MKRTGKILAVVISLLLVISYIGINGITVCKVKGCQRDVLADGYCTFHYLDDYAHRQNVIVATAMLAMLDADGVKETLEEIPTEYLPEYVGQMEEPLRSALLTVLDAVINLKHCKAEDCDREISQNFSDTYRYCTPHFIMFAAHKVVKGGVDGLVSGIKGLHLFSEPTAPIETEPPAAENLEPLGLVASAPT